jgi:hypothetical protein
MVERVGVVCIGSTSSSVSAGGVTGVTRGIEATGLDI